SDTGSDSLLAVADAVIDIADDRTRLGANDRSLLIVEDEVGFANLLLDVAREKEWKGIVATRGETALALARRHRPSAIVLDLDLPDLGGWCLLDGLKHDPLLSP